MNFAETVSWSTMVAVLATTTLLKPLDANGKEYSPPVKFTGDLIRCVNRLSHAIFWKLNYCTL